jgi:hypothetical protein
MAEPLTPEEEQKLRELRRRQAKMLRDKNRVRKYSPKKKSCDVDDKSGEN